MPSLVWDHFALGEDEAICSHCGKTLLCKGGSTSGLSRHLKSRHNICIENGRPAVVSTDVQRSVKQNIPSRVWQYFSPNSEGAICLYCRKLLRCNAGSTSGLIRHLKSIHSIDYENEKQDCPKYKKSKVEQSSEISFEYGEESLRSIVSELAAVDGFSVHSICRSRFIRESLNTKGYELPLSEAVIMDLINCQYRDIRQKVRNGIEHDIQQGARYSISLSECSSLQGRSYIDVSIHNNRGCVGLGLLRVTEPSNAEKTLKQLKRHLAAFGINDFCRSVVAIVCSNTPNMQKLSSSSGVGHRCCYAHRLHQAICETLYGTTIGVEVSNDLQDEDILYSGLQNVIPNTKDAPNFLPDIENVVEKVRKVITLFRHSKANNKVLQKYASEQNKEINLILDSKTVWSSTLDMVERFLHLRSCIVKALSDLFINLDISDLEFSFLHDLTCAIEPVKLAAEALCSQDTTLLSSEGIIEFLVKRIENQGSAMAKNLLCEVKRNFYVKHGDVVDLLRYINDPHSPISQNEHDTVVNNTKALVCRLFPETSVNVGNDRDQCKISEEIHSSSPEGKIEQVQLIEDDVEPPKANEEGINNINEIIELEATGKQHGRLKLINDALLSIPPATVEANRVLVAAGLFAPKIHSQLSDNSVNALTFLKNYFNREK